MFSTTTWTRNKWNSIKGYVDSFGILPGSGFETSGEEIVKLGLKKYDVDPCVFLREEEKGFCVRCIYVDDTIIAGEEGMMEDTTMRHGLVFHIKVQKSIQDFLECKIHEGVGIRFLLQKKIVNTLLSLPAIKKANKFKAPSAPGFFVVRPSEAEKVDSLTRIWYQFNIGCLQYLVKISRPDLANAVC